MDLRGKSWSWGRAATASPSGDSNSSPHLLSAAIKLEVGYQRVDITVDGANRSVFESVKELVLPCHSRVYSLAWQW